MPDSADIRKGIRFAIVGATTAAIYFGLLAILVEYVHLDYRLAVTVAYVVAVGFHFLSNRRFTFRAHEAKALPQLLRYLVLVGVSYLVTLTVVTIAVEVLRTDPMWGVVLAAAATMGLGFVVSKFWIFQSNP